MQPNVTHVPAMQANVEAVSRIIGELTETYYSMREQLLEARKVSPLGDRREHAVRCERCSADTWAIEPLCENCFAKLDDPTIR